MGTTPFLTRKEASEFLTSNGYPFSAGTLNKLFSQGGLPSLRPQAALCAERSSSLGREQDLQAATKLFGTSSPFDRRMHARPRWLKIKLQP
jgi:hypothetical protein